MKVIELIEKLNKLPPDWNISICYQRDIMPFFVNGEKSDIIDVEVEDERIAVIKIQDNLILLPDNLRIVK
jgi:hypothetical protein